MHTIVYTKNASRALRRIPKGRSTQIIGAINELSTQESPSLHPNVKHMKGDYAGFYRLRIGNYRAIFTLNPDPNAEHNLLLIAVSAVGTRQGIY